MSIVTIKLKVILTGRNFLWEIMTFSQHVVRLFKYNRENIRLAVHVKDKPFRTRRSNKRGESITSLCMYSKPCLKRPLKKKTK